MLLEPQIDESKETAEGFLTFLYGEALRGENTHLFLQAQRTLKKEDVVETEDTVDPDEASTDEHRGKGQLKTDGGWFQSPARLAKSSWLNRVLPYNSVYFSTGVVTGVRKENGKVINPSTGKPSRHGTANVAYTPIVWTDIDSCKELNLNADDFVEMLEREDDYSALVKSSEKGIQLYWRLETPFYINGDKPTFDDQLASLLYTIAYHYGGDFRAALPSQLLRLPGSYNHKPEYPDPILVTAKTRDTSYPIDTLRARFTPDPVSPPKVVVFAVAKHLKALWVSGQRHDIALALAGTMHQAYVDPPSMKALMRAVCHVFNDDEDRTVNVDTTYPIERDAELRTLASHDMTVHLAVKAACEWWMRHKVAYTKKMKIDYVPQRPTVASDEVVAETGVGNLIFRERNGKTYVVDGEDGVEAEFANFVLRIDYTLITPHGEEVWLADFISSFSREGRRTDICARDHSTVDAFIKSCCPPGAAVLTPRYWSFYIAWKALTKPPAVVYETNHYGVMDFRTPHATFVLPHEKHPKYEYRPANGVPDPLLPEFWSMAMSSEEVAAYLTSFVKAYSDYHAPEYIWPTLGWFAGCVIAPFIRKRHTGFPTLIVSGIAGCGKSDLMHRVLAMHYGIKHEHGYAGTTPFALQQVLGASNIVPCCLDEFRANTHAMEGGKQKEVEAIIRSLYDGSSASKGRADLSVREMRVLAPLSITGENTFTDEAAMQRSFCVLMERDALQDKKDAMRANPALKAQLTWLCAQEHRGKLGRILLDYVRAHQSELDELIAAAETEVDRFNSRYPIEVDRKRKGFCAVMAGLMLFRKMCIEYGIDLSEHPQDTWYESLFHADKSFKFGNTFDETGMRQLFDIIDHGMLELSRRRSAMNTIAVKNRQRPSVVWFELRRTHRMVLTSRLMGLTAALSTPETLEAMIWQSLRSDPETVFVGLGRGTDDKVIEAFGGKPPFNGTVVGIDMDKVASRYNVSTSSWVDMLENE